MATTKRRQNIIFAHKNVITHMKPRRLLVSSPRNSTCGSAKLSELDWSEWFTDGLSLFLNGAQYPLRSSYLHVHHRDGETIHGVYCRHSDTPRLAMRGGKLYWLID